MLEWLQKRQRFVGDKSFGQSLSFALSPLISHPTLPTAKHRAVDDGGVEENTERGVTSELVSDLYLRHVNGKTLARSQHRGRMKWPSWDRRVRGAFLKTEVVPRSPADQWGLRGRPLS